MHAKFCKRGGREKEKKEERKEEERKEKEGRKFIWITVATNLAMVDLYWCLICFILLWSSGWRVTLTALTAFRIADQVQDHFQLKTYYLWSNVYCLEVDCCITSHVYHFWAEGDFLGKQKSTDSSILRLEMHEVDSPPFSSNALLLHFEMRMKISPFILLQYIFLLLAVNDLIRFWVSCTSAAP